jgi:hypothetical protein
MTPDQLRAMADALDRAPGTTLGDREVKAAAAFLRQCAEQVPVAVMIESRDGLTKFASKLDSEAHAIALVLKDRYVVHALFAAPVAHPEGFDAWQENPYTKVLQKSIAEDYVPRTKPLTDELTENVYSDVNLLPLSAAPVWQPDCRTCQNVSIRSGGCSSVFLCVDASMYKASPPVRYWKDTK